MTAIFSIIKRLFASNKVSFAITIIVVVCATTSRDSTFALSNGNYTWILAVMMPFFTVFYDYAKIMYLGASKKDYFLGSLASYGIMALTISICNTMIHVLIDPLNHTQEVINLMDLCGWTTNGIVIAFIQQTVFLLLIMIFLHVLLSMQYYWYGWLADGILVGIICVFTPIAALRHILAGFFKVIMFNSNVLFHLSLCLLLSVILVLLGLVVLKRKTL